MTDKHVNELTKIDAHLQCLDEQLLALLNERQDLIAEYEAELAKTSIYTPLLNLKLNFFFHILKTVMMSTHLNGRKKWPK